MNNKHGIPDHLFAKDLGDDTVTWTIATRTAQMLRELQELYGPRDLSWTFVGVAFWEQGPMIWYPSKNIKPHSKQVAIHLSAQAFSNNKEAMYQLSHECVHLLAPSGRRGAPVMEEGLAYRYSREILERVFSHPLDQPYGKADNYVAAGRAVGKLLEHDSEAIRKLRVVQPAFYEMTPATFTEAGMQVPAELIAELLRPFNQG
ncbi:hypothetical protein ACLE0S_002546 [Cronobacter malonaticus]